MRTRTPTRPGAGLKPTGLPGPVVITNDAKDGEVLKRIASDAAFQQSAEFMSSKSKSCVWYGFSD